MPRCFVPFLLTLTACARGGGGADAGPSSDSQEAPRPIRSAAELPPEKLDLQGIRSRGSLRFLIRGLPGQKFLPRSGGAVADDAEQAEAFARRLGAEAVFVSVERYDELIPALLDGKGDVIATGLSVTDARIKKVVFARSVRGASEVLVGRRGMEDPPKSLEDLAGREVHVRASSSYAETLKSLEIEGLRWVAVPEALDTAEIVADVAAGDRPLTVADAPIVEAVRAYAPDAMALFPLREGRKLAWAVRPDDPELRAAIERFQTERALTGELDAQFLGDLEGISERGVLRVLTRNNPVTYFLHRGRPRGFEYELMQLFADDLDVRLLMVVAPDREALVPWLLEGRGDIIAASLTATRERKEKVSFSTPYLFVDEVVVQPEEGDPIASVGELAGREVHARRSSAYWGSLETLMGKGIELTAVAAPETRETESLIGDVASGKRPLTVADSHILQVEKTYGVAVQAGPNLAADGPEDIAKKPIAFAVRPNAVQLRARLDDFVKKNYRGLKYNILRKRYFEDPRRIRAQKEARVDKTGRISRYDELIKKYSQRYGFDWRLMTAQAFVESGFDASARSWVGALGLFQVMPNTGKSLGLADLTRPEVGIHAGIKYMSRLISRFDAELPFAERVWLALAAYNVGLGHVNDARRLAREKGWDPDRWFGNVERAMRLLSKKEYARRARHGYCRGGEPVAYVRRIRDVYQAYQRATGGPRDERVKP